VRKRMMFVDRMLWNVDRSNVCFYEISCLAIAISSRPKSAKGGSVDCFDPNRSSAPTGYRIAASVCCTSKNTLGTEKGAQVAGQPELVHAVAVRANMRSILVAMMKSFSCSPLIFLVCRETVALPQPKLIFG
jgi:hypothetical protein